MQYPRFQYRAVNGQLEKRRIEAPEQESPDWHESPAGLLVVAPDLPPHNGLACAVADEKFKANWERLTAENQQLRARNADLEGEIEDLRAQMNQQPQPAPEQPNEEGATGDSASEQEPAEQAESDAPAETPKRRGRPRNNPPA